MSKPIWEIEGYEITNCSCDYGCPCQFNALPTDNTCRAVSFTKIDRGYHGETSLDGLMFGFSIDFPNPIHEGNGTHQLYIDERANTEQRAALIRIGRGQDTEPMTTHFFLYHEMSSNRLEPVILPMSVEIDLEGATGRATVGDIIRSSWEPIRNSVTNEIHRAQICLPEGIEYEVAEMASGSTQSSGDIPLELSGSYGQLSQLHMNSAGVVR
ncbi:DUF1326 domain-containing protein [Pseudomonadota bacterium]